MQFAKLLALASGSLGTSKLRCTLTFQIERERRYSRGERLMSDDKGKEILSRRGFLGMGSAALAAAGMLKATEAAGQEQKPYPTKDDRSASAPGPGNPPLDEQNPDS